MKGFTKLFVDALKATGRTQKQLAEIAGASQTQVNRNINGERGFSIEVIDKLTEELGLTVRIEAGGVPIASNLPSQELREALDRLRSLYPGFSRTFPEMEINPEASDAEMVEMISEYFELVIEATDESKYPRHR